MLTSVQAAADVTHDKTYPSCDVQAQRSVKGETGGSVTDPLEAYIFLRVNIFLIPHSFRLLNRAVAIAASGEEELRLKTHFGQMLFLTVNVKYFHLKLKKRV